MTIEPEDKIRYVLRDMSALLYECCRKLTAPEADLNPRVNKSVANTLLNVSIKLNCLQCLWVEEPSVMLRPDEEENVPQDFEFYSLFEMPKELTHKLPTWHPYQKMIPYPMKTSRERTQEG
jgi:hypothetical protein